MKRVAFGVGIAMAAVAALSWCVPVQADIPAAVKITLVQAAGSDAKFERIDLTNISTETADLTNWKLVYKSASGGTTTQLLQLQASANWHVLLDAGDRESFVSKELAAASGVSSSLHSAEQFSGGMNHLGGAVQLLDASGQIQDMVGWGTATESVRLGESAPAISSSTWLVRHSEVGNNFVDFQLEAQDPLNPAHIGSIYDAQDSCSNLPGLQLVTPDGYVRSIDNSCQPVDVCTNLSDIQVTLPIGMEYDANGDCQLIDVCRNLDAIQMVIPDGYELTGPGVCEVLLPMRNLLITELLPNPSGSDAGNEFIEIYNADNEAVQLSSYRLAIGDRLYDFPAGAVIAAGGYYIVSDSDIGGSLPNTTGLPVYLVTIRGLEISRVPAYVNAGDDVAWALVDDEWRYTYASTPRSVNIYLADFPCQPGYERDEATHRCRKLVSEATVSPCRESQYRSEETGRCRSLVATSSPLPCKDGQYRSEETNRCRSLTVLATSALKTCADDQFRNPLTNRCKSIASSDELALADCGEGRERNPDTNRCRNVQSASVPEAAFAVESIKDVGSAFVGWWAIGSIGIVALGYGVWEWRREIYIGMRKIGILFHVRK